MSTLSATHVTARGLIGTSKAAVQKTSDTCAGDCGLRHWHYVLLALIEEFLEFAGVAVAVGAVAGTFEWRLDRHGLRVRYLGSDADRRQAARQRADAGSVLGRTAAADVVQPASCLRD